VEADGRIAELAAQKCFEGMLVSVQGSLSVQNMEGGPVAGSTILVSRLFPCWLQQGVTQGAGGPFAGPAAA
jgi:hypothetical protein